MCCSFMQLVIFSQRGTNVFSVTAINSRVGISRCIIKMKYDYKGVMDCNAEMSVCKKYFTSGCLTFAPVKCTNFKQVDQNLI